MKKIYTCLVLLCLTIVSFAQSPEQHSKVKVWLLNNTMAELNELNLDTDHGSYKINTWFVTDFSSSEIEVLEEASFDYEILIEDVAKFYEERNYESVSNETNGAGCGSNDFEIPTVVNYSNGSMGGFFTYQELLDNLDAMLAQYPNLISAREQIGTFTTIEGRPIYFVRMSNTPNVYDSAEPEMLYTALHHSREPASMQQLVYYMWYLLENYDNNPEIAYLLDNVQLNFVPCINVDGYLYNEATNPNGGGMHRKNRRDVGTNNKGVDLNRNYSYQYGGVGTSTNPNSDVYKGTGAFSEPETEAMKWFVEQHEFKIAMNYHSHADELLFPWGYSDNVQCADYDFYIALTDYMTSENNYLNRQSALLYEAAGDSDDWGYGDTSTKPKVFTMTPEVGSNNDGFWPSTNNILGICQENVFQNLAAALSLLDNYEIKDLSPSILPSTSLDLDFELQRLGLQVTDYTVAISSLDAILSNVSGPEVVSGLEFGGTGAINFTGDLDANSVQNGVVTFLITVNTASYTFYDTISKFYGSQEVVFEAIDGTMNNWSSTGNWDLDTDAYSAPTSISDSPNGNYSNSDENILISQAINLSLSEVAVLEFFAKWDIEQGYDFAQVSARVLGTNAWTALCGSYTSTGNDNQDEGEPIFDGEQNSWVKESMNLNDFVGESIELRFRLKSDNFEDGDGFLFDDMKVLAIQDSTQSGIRELPLSEINVYPNPAQANIFIQSDILWENAQLEIRNMLGQVVLKESYSGVEARLNVAQFPDGVYQVYIKKEQQLKAKAQFVIY